MGSKRTDPIRGLTIVNLVAAGSIGLLGLYAWSLTMTERTRVPLSSPNVGPDAYVFQSSSLIWRHVVHPHARFAYTAWAVALVIVAICLWRLRRQSSTSTRGRPEGQQ